ncbi:hypothetical protein F5Y18DRAFT_398146 [Xylariaceae sp. FL1019]|nr:hypothetical protein F5Y18DRAFT_398146 [Xylariaceae sp. FL1019]
MDNSSVHLSRLLRGDNLTRSDYSDDDISIVWEIIQRAETILAEDLTPSSRLHTHALFLAYGEVIRERDLDPHERHLSKLVFMIGGIKTDQTLQEKFHDAMQRLDITIVHEGPEQSGSIDGDDTKSVAESYQESHPESQPESYPDEGDEPDGDKEKLLAALAKGFSDRRTKAQAINMLRARHAEQSESPPERPPESYPQSYPESRDESHDDDYDDEPDSDKEKLLAQLAQGFSDRRDKAQAVSMMRTRQSESHPQSYPENRDESHDDDYDDEPDSDKEKLLAQLAQGFSDRRDKAQAVSMMRNRQSESYPQRYSEVHPETRDDDFEEPDSDKENRLAALAQGFSDRRAKAQAVNMMRNRHLESHPESYVESCDESDESYDDEHDDDQEEHGDKEKLLAALAQGYSSYRTKIQAVNTLRTHRFKSAAEANFRRQADAFANAVTGYRAKEHLTTWRSQAVAVEQQRAVIAEQLAERARDEAQRAREDEDFEDDPYLARIAQKTHENLSMSRALAKWSNRAEEEAETQLARRHMLRTRYFGILMDYTKMQTSKVEQFKEDTQIKRARHALSTWRNRAAAQEQQAWENQMEIEETRNHQQFEVGLYKWRGTAHQARAKESTLVDYARGCEFYQKTTRALPVMAKKAEEAQKKDELMALYAYRADYYYKTTHAISGWRKKAQEVAKKRQLQEHYAERADYYYKTTHAIADWRPEAKRVRKERLKEAHLETRRMVKKGMGARCVTQWQDKVEESNRYIQELNHRLEIALERKEYRQKSNALSTWRLRARERDAAAAASEAYAKQKALEQLRQRPEVERRDARSLIGNWRENTPGRPQLFLSSAREATTTPLAPRKGLRVSWA